MALIGREGGDPIRAMDWDGIVMFLLGFAILFSMRLIFWPPVPAALRSTVRVLICAILVIGMLLSVLGLALALNLRATLRHASAPIYFSTLAVLCQPIAALWLARYRQEGLR